MALILLSLLAVVGTVVLRSPDVSEQSADAGGSLPAPKDAVVGSERPTEIEGRLFLEAALGDDDPLGDPKLEPAEVCTVRVWQEGRNVAEPSACGTQGRFLAVLHSGVSGRVSVELEAPGRLRAVVTVDVADGGHGVLPNVAVGRAQTIAGQVVDLRGAPVSGVVVQARPIPDLGEPEPWRRTTGEDGSFSFDTLPPGPVALRCDAAGHAPTVVEAIAPQDDVLLRLGGLYDVRGRVLAAGTEADVAAASVRLEGSGVWPARVVDVEPDGSFVVPQVPDGVYALEAVVPGEPGEPAFASLPLEGVEPDLEVTLALMPAQWVPVQVEDPEGAAVAGARVTLMNAQVGLLGRTATTGEDGRAWIGPVVPGPYVARADADGLLGSAPEAVQVEESTPDRVTLTLQRPGRLVVSVVGPGGAAVPDARVALETEALYSVGEAQTRAAAFARKTEVAGTLGVMPGPIPPVPLGDDEHAAQWRKTGGAGRVAFEGLVAGAYTVTARHRDFASSAERTVSVKAGETAELTLMLREGQPLTGRVRDGNDRPVEGAQIRVNDVLLARTDARGVYDAGPHAGRVRVSVRAAGFASQSKTLTVVSSPVDTEWTLQDADGVLEGQVLGGNERPVEGARVDVHPRNGQSQTAWTDDKGSFRFEGLPRGRAEVAVEHADYVAASKPVSVAQAGSVTVVLEAGWSSTVVVRWSGTLEPVEGARIRGGGLDVRADARGDAVLSGLSARTVKLEVSALGAPTVRKTLERRAAEGKTVFVELTEGGTLRGVVADYRGDPVRRAEVEVRLPGADAPLATTRAGARGKFVFEGLPEGDVELQAWPPASRDGELDTEVVRSDVRRGHITRGVEFRLPRGE